MDKNMETKIFQNVEAQKADLLAMSKEIWNHPEVGFQEKFACKTLTDYLKAKGFEVQVGVYGMETAFSAKKGDGNGPVVTFVAEYDALPGLGHACGHNLYCCAAVGAAVALDEVTGSKGITIQVAGTPAEEGGGGKIPFVEAGYFDNVDIAMMCHAEDTTVVERVLVATHSTHVVFHGKSAHAGGSPEKGVNALTAGVLTYNNINALRQHFIPGHIVSAVINDGGVMANTIPDRCEMSISIRTASMKDRAELSHKVDNCIEAAALVTGCTYETEKTKRPYDDVMPNHQLGLSYRKGLEAIGYKAEEIVQSDWRSFGWDMGNISHVCPSLAPYMRMGRLGLVGHTDEFRECSNSELAYQSLVDSAKALAYTAYDYCTDPEMQKAVKAEFEAKK